VKCKRSQRWISDNLDGALPDKKRRRLEAHLSACSACRAYQRDLARLQAESRGVKAGPVAADYFENFTAAVETRIRREREYTRRAGYFPVRWRWAWLFVPLALAIVLGLLFRSGGKSVHNEIFSFEACLDRVFQEIGGDDEVAADFSRFLSSSILGGGEEVILEDDVDLLSEPFFWRSLSDEDLRLIEEEIKKSIRS
jgi:anti-sigma factor RsiW